MNPRTAGPSPVWTPLVWASMVLFGMVVIGLTLFAASGGVRGSDQYWYLADVETLVRDHAITSSTVFPVGLLGPDPSLPPPFIHNVLSIYLAALPAVVLGPLGGWLTLNLASTLATAGLIYLAARTVASRWAALVCAVLYPLLPLTIWQTEQPLAEASTSLFAALAIYLIAIAGASLPRWLLVAGAVGLLYVSRESYLPLLLAVPLAFLVVRTRDRPGGLLRALPPTALVGVAVLAMLATAQIAFSTENVHFSYARLLHTAVPGQTSNMWFNFDLSPANLADRLPLSLDLLVPKLVGHLAEQFVAFDSLPAASFYWVFNILALVAVASLWRFRDRQRRRIVLAALSLVAIHFITIVLFQNQFRYTLPALPGLLVVFAMVLSDLPMLERLVARRPIAIVLGLTLLALGPDALLARMARDDGIANAAVAASTERLLDRYLPAGAPALIVYTETPHVLAYAARPRLVLYVTADYSRAELDRLRQAFPARWILAPVDSPVLATLAIEPGREVGDIDALGGRWGLFQLPD